MNFNSTTKKCFVPILIMNINAKFTMILEKYLKYLKLKLKSDMAVTLARYLNTKYKNMLMRFRYSEILSKIIFLKYLPIIQNIILDHR